MILYWDSSAFVLLYVELPGRREAEAAFAGTERNLVSKLTLLETFRSLAALAARGTIAWTQARRAQRQLRGDQLRLAARSVDHLLRSEPLGKLVTLLERHAGLGTNDVLHLTTAVLWKTELRRKLTFVTRDRALGSAARSERLEVLMPGASS